MCVVPRVNLPAGFSANNTAVPTCTTSELNSAASIELGLPPCPPGSTVGKISFDFGGRLITVPIYNMEVTSFGVTAELGFLVYTSTQILTVSVRPGDEGLTVTDPEIENLGEPHDITVTIWGVPASHEHNVERQQTCEPHKQIQVEKDMRKQGSVGPRRRISPLSRSCRIRRVANRTSRR